GQGPTARYLQADEAPPPTGAAPSPPASPSPPSLRQEQPRARPAVSTLRPTRQGHKGDTAPPPAGWQVPRASRRQPAPMPLSQSGPHRDQPAVPTKTQAAVRQPAPRPRRVIAVRVPARRD